MTKPGQVNPPVPNADLSAEAIESIFNFVAPQQLGTLRDLAASHFLPSAYAVFSVVTTGFSRQKDFLLGFVALTVGRSTDPMVPDKTDLTVKLVNWFDQPVADAVRERLSKTAEKMTEMNNPGPFDEAMLRDYGVPPAQCREDLVNCIDQPQIDVPYPIVGHNLNFDLDFAREFTARPELAPSDRRIDTGTICQAAFNGVGIPPTAACAEELYAHTKWTASTTGLSCGCGREPAPSTWIRWVSNCGARRSLWPPVEHLRASAIAGGRRSFVD